MKKKTSKHHLFIYRQLTVNFHPWRPSALCGSVHVCMIQKFIGSKTSTLPETNISKLKIGRNPKGKGSSSNHPFSAAFAVSYRECILVGWHLHAYRPIDLKHRISRPYSSIYPVWFRCSTTLVSTLMNTIVLQTWWVFPKHMLLVHVSNSVKTLPRKVEIVWVIVMVMSHYNGYIDPYWVDEFISYHMGKSMEGFEFTRRLLLLLGFTA